MVIHGLLEITQTPVGVVKISISHSFFEPLSQFLCNAQILIVIIYGLFCLSVPLPPQCSELVCSYLYSLFEITKTIVGDAKISISVSFSISPSQFLYNAQGLFQVIYGLFEITQTVVGVAKICISASFSISLSQFLCNLHSFLEVVYGLLEITQTVAGVANISINGCFYISLSKFLCNTLRFLLVIYGLFEITKTVAGDAKICINASFYISLPVPLQWSGPTCGNLWPV